MPPARSLPSLPPVALIFKALLLVVPVSAIIPTGKRNIAFVDKGGGKLEPRVVELGGKFGDVYAVKSGLKEGERIVASANFLIDAESKIQGALKDFEQQ